MWCRRKVSVKVIPVMQLAHECATAILVSRTMAGEPAPIALCEGVVEVDIRAGPMQHVTAVPPRRPAVESDTKETESKVKKVPAGRFAG